MSLYGFQSGSNTVKDGTPAPDGAKPKLSDRFMRQARPNRALAWGGYSAPSACGSYTCAGGTFATTETAAFPYWTMLMFGTPAVYRLMIQQQTIALARYVVTGPVRASSWDMTWTDGVEQSRDKRKVDEGDPAIRYLKDEILPLRRKVIRDAIRAIDYGWQPFAVTWEIRNGMYVPNLRSLLPDATTVLQDDGGNFAGLENYPEKGKEVRFNDLESWAPTLDAEAGYAYGRSRLENVRTTAWAPWLDTMMQMRSLQGKLSGIVPIVSHAPNGYTDDDGNQVNYADEANTVLKEIPQGRGIRLEALFDPREIIDKAPELADKLSKLKVIDVDFYDAGSVSPAMIGFIQSLEYLDKQMFRGMLRPERAGLEAVAAGSRADSEQHTETGAADSEAIDADLTESFDEHVVRTALRLNFGEEKARQLHVISTPLLKWKQQVFREVITRLFSIPDIAISASKSLDLNTMFSQMSLPRLTDFVFEAAKQNPAPPADSGVKPANGNGRMNGDGAKQFAELLHTAFSGDRGALASSLT